jgi:hypothetical protein
MTGGALSPGAWTAAQGLIFLVLLVALEIWNERNASV